VPDVTEFELIGDNVEVLRELARQFEEQDTITIRKGKKETVSVHYLFGFKQILDLPTGNLYKSDTGGQENNFSSKISFIPKCFSSIFSSTENSNFPDTNPI
jgi:hypothetical protein